MRRIDAMAKEEKRKRGRMRCMEMRVKKVNNVCATACVQAKSESGRETYIDNGCRGTSIITFVI